jgi:arginase
MSQHAKNLTQWATWRESWLADTARVSLIAAGYGFGQRKKGLEKTPERLLELEPLRSRLLAKRLLEFPPLYSEISPSFADQSQTWQERFPEEFFNQTLLADLLQRVAHVSSKQAWLKDFVLTIGGDHSLAAGSVFGVAQAWENLGCVWIDAHGDFNSPETSPSGNFHGMPLAALTGAFDLASHRGFSWFSPVLKPSDVVLIGVRAIDDLEEDLLVRQGIRRYTSRTVAIEGLPAVLEDALGFLNQKGKRPLHLSFDIDALDASLVPGTGTPEPGGLLLDECVEMVEKLRDSGQLVAMDLVEVNPDLEIPLSPEWRSGTQTLYCAARLISAALLSDSSTRVAKR